MLSILIHALDIVGAIFAFISTIFYVRASVHAWPIGLIAISMNIVLYLLTGLYADAAKEGIYWVSSIIGWYWWWRGGANQAQLPIKRLTIKHGLILSAIAGSGTYGLVLLLSHVMQSTVPYWDATTTVLSLIAQWLICRKIIECWAIWFVVDALYAGLYFYKDLTAHGILLTIYTIMAIVGYCVWKRIYDKTSNEMCKGLLRA